MDQIHAFAESEILVKQAQAAKADVVLSEVRSEDPYHHEAWKAVYAADYLYDWLLDSTRERAWRYVEGDRAHLMAMQSAAGIFKPYFDLAYNHVQLEQTLINNRFTWCMAGNAVLATLMPLKLLQTSTFALAAMGVAWNAFAGLKIFLGWLAESKMHELSDEVLRCWNNCMPESSWVRHWLPATMAGGGRSWVHRAVRIIGVFVFAGFMTFWIYVAITAPNSNS